MKGFFGGFLGEEGWGGREREGEDSLGALDRCGGGRLSIVLMAVLLVTSSASFTPWIIDTNAPLPPRLAVVVYRFNGVNYRLFNRNDWIRQPSGRRRGCGTRSLRPEGALGFRNPETEDNGRRMTAGVGTRVGVALGGGTIAGGVVRAALSSLNVGAWREIGPATRKSSSASEIVSASPAPIFV